MRGQIKRGLNYKRTVTAIYGNEQPIVYLMWAENSISPKCMSESDYRTTCAYQQLSKHKNNRMKLGDA